MGKLDWVKRTYAVFLLCAATAIALPAQTLTTLHSFDETDGRGPDGPLIQAADRNLYGTTLFGGTGELYGTVFKITPSGALTTLYSFCPQSCPHGQNPSGAMIQATDGNFYGTTSGGGGGGGGTIFKISPSGMLTTLYAFCSQSLCTDGYYPLGGLIQATDGSFYGTTTYGGGGGGGTIFEISPSGALKTLYSFCLEYLCPDGQTLQTGLVQGSDGNFYGTTTYGGANFSGTIFKITPAGTLTTLYNFCSQSGCTDGDDPFAPLVQATDGNLYGTTYHGGPNETYCQGFGCGTLFKITPSGMLTTLYTFCSQSGCADGWAPYAGLIQATDGNFYGTTTYGGANNSGTVFKITPSGTLTTLHSFDFTDGATPQAALVQDTNGSFYSTTYEGGTGSCSFGCGTVFSLSVGLGPFVEPQTTSGKVGRVVKILGMNLTEASSVSFHGTAAAFTVVSSSQIAATVPVGATSGKIQVVTPGGTLSSNVPFRVLP